MRSLAYLALFFSAILLPGALSHSFHARQTPSDLGCVPISALLPSLTTRRSTSPLARFAHIRDTLPCDVTCLNGGYQYSASALGGAECICSNTLDATQIVQADSDGNCPAGTLVLTDTGILSSVTASTVTPSSAAPTDTGAASPTDTGAAASPSDTGSTASPTDTGVAGSATETDTGSATDNGSANSVSPTDTSSPSVTDTTSATATDSGIAAILASLSNDIFGPSGILPIVGSPTSTPSASSPSVVLSISTTGSTSFLESISTVSSTGPTDTSSSTATDSGVGTSPTDTGLGGSASGTSTSTSPSPTSSSLLPGTVLGCAPLTALFPSLSTDGSTASRIVVDCADTCTMGGYEFSAVADGGAECICSADIDTTQIVPQNSDGSCPSGDLLVTDTPGVLTASLTVGSATGTSTSTDTSGGASVTDTSNATPTDTSGGIGPGTGASPTDTGATAPTDTSGGTGSGTSVSPTDTGAGATPTDTSGGTGSGIGASPTDTGAGTTPTDTSGGTGSGTGASPTDTGAGASPTGATASGTDTGLGASATSAAATTSSSPSATTPTSLPSYTPLGCYSEPVPYDPTVHAIVNATTGPLSTQTVESCIEFCYNQNLPLAALESGDTCYCSDGIYNGGEPDPAGGCDLACAGNATEICGGDFLFNLYADPAFLNSFFAKAPAAAFHAEKRNIGRYARALFKFF